MPASNDASLMLPPPPRPSKAGPIVLEEDEWTEKLEAIIERDYFPDLPKLQNKLEWLQAANSGDPEKIRLARQNIMARMTQERERSSVQFTPGQGTPNSRFATPALDTETPQEGRIPASPRAGALLEDLAPSSTVDPHAHAPNMSLDKFVCKYTSEDNASFNVLLNKMNESKAAKNKWLAEQGTKDSLRLENGPRQAALTDGFGSTGQEIATLDYNNNPSKNKLFYDSSQQPHNELSVREVQYAARRPPKEIAKTNTRFITNSSGQPILLESTESTPSSTPLKGTPSRPAEAGDRQGYSTIGEPSPVVGVGESPFMTWGRLDSTPLRLDPEETPVDIGGADLGPAFKIASTPLRDKMQRKLAQTASANVKARRGSTPSPSPVRQGFGTPRTPAQTSRVGQLSAAGRNLLSAHRAQMGLNSDAQLRQSYTKQGGTPSRGTPSRGTPSRAIPSGTPRGTPARLSTAQGTPSRSESAPSRKQHVQASSGPAPVGSMAAALEQVRSSEAGKIRSRPEGERVDRVSDKRARTSSTNITDDLLNI